MRTRELSAKVPIEEFNRFKAHVPAWGGPTWFLNTALRDFNDLLDREPSLRERAREMVEKMMREEPELQDNEKPVRTTG